MRNFQPNWCSPPGETIQNIANQRSITESDLMNFLNLHNDELQYLLKGFIKLTDEIAEKLEIALGVSKSFWINREKNYYESLKLQASNCESWIDDLPVSDLVDRGYIRKRSPKPYKVAQCLDFFESKAMDDWETKYKDQLTQVAFRTSNSYDSAPLAVTTWLRLAELNCQDQVVKQFDKELLNSKINDIKSLSRISAPSDFLPLLENILNQCGVKLAVVKGIKGCKASGATFFVDENPIVVLSFRYLSDDHFWFTLLHELGHVILHSSEMIFIESKSNTVVEKASETEANEFAMNALVPKQYQNYLFSLGVKDIRKIMRLAKELDISPGILVGQLQHKKIVPYAYLNKLKVKYKWG